MEGTTMTKAVRLVGDLVGHPTMIPRYVSANLIKKSPIQMRLPWISFAAIDFLSKWLQESMNVFEWGAGGSTLFFASRVNRVVSIENDLNWYNQVHESLCTSLCSNVDLRLLPVSDGDIEQFKGTKYLFAVKESKWDVILIDGVLGYGSGGQFGSYRQACYRLAEECVLPGGIIVVDDIWMFPELSKINKANAYEEFKSVGPCRPGVTSTGVFFY